jgi:hypothetical protein
MDAPATVADTAAVKASVAAVVVASTATGTVAASMAAVAADSTAAAVVVASMAVAVATAVVDTGNTYRS